MLARIARVPGICTLMLGERGLAFRGEGRGAGEPRASVDVAYVVVGIAVPIATFSGLWLWRLRGGAARYASDEARSREAELVQSVTAVRTGLNELREQVTLWSRDLEERDRELAERISGLIDVTEKAAANGDPLAAALGDPRRAGETTRQARQTKRGV